MQMKQCQFSRWFCLQRYSQNVLESSFVDLTTLLFEGEAEKRPGFNKWAEVRMVAIVEKSTLGEYEENDTDVPQLVKKS